MIQFTLFIQMSFDSTYVMQDAGAIMMNKTHRHPTLGFHKYRVFIIYSGWKRKTKQRPSLCFQTMYIK